MRKSKIKGTETAVICCVTPRSGNEQMRDLKAKATQALFTYIKIS
jgi:hypothetical protein